MKIIYKHVLHMGILSDIFIENGMIQQICDADVLLADEHTKIIDAEGYLILPAFVDCHAHLDKTIMGMDVRVDRSYATGLQSVIENERRLRRTLGLDPFTQASRYLEKVISLGTLYLRSHVDVDTENGLAGLEGVLAAKEKYRDKIQLQLVAFPQSGFVCRPGTYELMDEALAMGADIVGGLDPSTIDQDAKTSIDAMFRLAEKHSKPIDIHLHEPSELGAFSMGMICDRAIALGMQGKVAISHAFCLSSSNQSMVNLLIEKLQKAGITIITSASSDDSPLIKPLHDGGVAICAGNDNVNDLWSPYGTGDMLERVRYVAMRNDYRSDKDLQIALHTCTTDGARLFGLPDYGVGVGYKADFVLIKGKSLTETIANGSLDRIVVKDGVMISK